MSLVTIIVFLIVIGFALWLVQQIPMASQVRSIITGVVIFFVVLWVIQALGLYNFGLRLR